MKWLLKMSPTSFLYFLIWFKFLVYIFVAGQKVWISHRRIDKKTNTLYCYPAGQKHPLIAVLTRLQARPRFYMNFFFTSSRSGPFMFLAFTGRHPIPGGLCPQFAWHATVVSAPVSFQAGGFLTNVNDLCFWEQYTSRSARDLILLLPRYCAPRLAVTLRANFWRSVKDQVLAPYVRIVKMNTKNNFILDSLY